MASIWIVHRDPTMRAALARLAGAPPDTLVGAPGSPEFDDAAAPDAILLGLAEDLEAELEFAHRMASRLRGTRWILVGESAELERAHGLFDTLPAVFFTFPPEPSILRAALKAARRPPSTEPLPLSQRPARDALSERFSRAFADLELPELLHAFDPRLGRLPVLVLGEPGTGRGTLVRYVHQFGPTLGGTLIELDCTPSTSAETLIERITLGARHDRAPHATSLWLREAHRLDTAVQREAAGWIAYGLPWGAPRTRLLRWFGTADAEALEPELRRALGGLSVTIPPLRERAGRFSNLANGTAAAWCAAHGQPPRRLAEDALEALAEYPWPGNLGELEAVIGQSLAASAADPLAAADLLLDGAPFVPVPAFELGVLLDRSETDAAPPAHPPTPAGRAVGIAEDEAQRFEEDFARDEAGEVFDDDEDGFDDDFDEEEEDDFGDELVAEPYRDERVAEQELPEAEILELPPFPPADDDEAPLDAEPEFLEPIEEILPQPIPAPVSAPEPEFLEPIEEILPQPIPAPVYAPEPEFLEPIEEILPQPAPERAPPSREEGRGTLQRLARAVSHEVRNPLTAVRTFAELLPERFEDADFRSHFTRMAEESLGRVEAVLARLEELAGFPRPERRAVDVGALLREVLDKRRSTIHGRRLVVLEELDRTDPTALCDPEQLRFAFEALIDGSLALVPERGDVYLASRRHESGLRGAPSVRVLLRYRGPQAEAGAAPGAGDLSPAANALSFALADIVLRAQGGTLAVDTSDRNETVLVVDLPS